MEKGSRRTSVFYIWQFCWSLVVYRPIFWRWVWTIFIIASLHRTIFIIATLAFSVKPNFYVFEFSFKKISYAEHGFPLYSEEEIKVFNISQAFEHSYKLNHGGSDNNLQKQFRKKNLAEKVRNKQFLQIVSGSPMVQFISMFKCLWYVKYFCFFFWVQWKTMLSINFFWRETGKHRNLVWRGMQEWLW